MQVDAKHLLAAMPIAEAEGMGLEPTTGFPAPHFQSVDAAEATHDVSTDCETTYVEKHQAAKTVGDAQVTVQLAKAEQTWPFDESALSLAELCHIIELAAVLPRGIKAGVIALIKSVETASTPTSD